MYGFSHKDSRPATYELIELAEEGVLDWESIARAALMWMSESEVAHFARANEFVEEDEDFDDSVDEAQEWADFDPDC